MSSVVKSIRLQLGMTQAELAARLGVTQGVVSHFEVGRRVLNPSMAAKLIRAARGRGVQVTFDTLYGHLLRRTPPARAEPRA